MITLFVAVAFLASGFQLYNLVIKDGGQARVDSRASNVAYDYLRRYVTTAATPCNPSTLASTSITPAPTGLSNVTVSVSITCPYAALLTVSKIEVTVRYNSPQQTMKYSTYVKP